MNFTHRMLNLYRRAGQPDNGSRSTGTHHLSFNDGLVVANKVFFTFFLIRYVPQVCFFIRSNILLNHAHHFKSDMFLKCAYHFGLDMFVNVLLILDGHFP